MGTKDSLTELMTKSEPLNPELEARMSVVSGLKQIHHPLMIEIMPNKRLYAFYNKRLEVKKQAIAKYLSEKKLSSYVFMHEKPYRLDAFIEFVEMTNYPKDQEYWETISDIWRTVENIWQQKAEWKSVLVSENNHLFMTKEEREFLNALPDEVTVYRGCNIKNEDGYSYTLSIETAQFFSKRIGCKDGYIIKKVVPKKNIFAYTDGRNESEIIIL